MHEVGLMQTALELAAEQTRRQGASAIHRIRLRVGNLSGAVPEALEFAFEAISQGTLAEGAQLEIERVAVVCHCETCDREFQPDDVVFECPRCGELSVDVRQGRELELAQLEVS